MNTILTNTQDYRKAELAIKKEAFKANDIILFEYKYLKLVKERFPKAYKLAKLIMSNLLDKKFKNK